MRLNGFGWFAVRNADWLTKRHLHPTYRPALRLACMAVSLATCLVIAGCGSVGQPKPSVEFKVAVPVKTITAQNFAWGEDRPRCDPFFHEVCTTNPETGEETCGCVPD